MKLEIRNISKKYQNNYALFNISTTLKPGLLIGLVGSNGAGKSTFLKILSTIIRPSSGEILLDGENIMKHPDNIRKILGYLPQQVSVYPNLTAVEFLSYMAAMKQIPRIQAKEQISNLLNQLHLCQESTKRLSSFSGGMKQRIGIACALLGEPQIVIVDEPTIGLDPQERITVRNILSEYARTHMVILSTHVISDIEAAASRLLILKKSLLLFDGTPEELIKRATGHVWEYMKPSGSDVSSLQYASSIIQKKDGSKIRQISAASPAPSARNVEPSLEDACLYEMEESLI